MGKLVNEETAAKLIGISHRNIIRWRQAGKRGKNPPYFVVQRGGVTAHLYDLELLDMWLQAKNNLEIKSKVPRRKQSVFPWTGGEWKPDNLIEGEQQYVPRTSDPVAPKIGIQEAIALANERMNKRSGAEFVTFIDDEGATHIRVHRK